MGTLTEQRVRHSILKLTVQRRRFIISLRWHTPNPNWETLNHFNKYQQILYLITSWILYVSVWIQRMMYNKAKKWFNEIDGKRTEGNFNFRLKDKESISYLKKFPWLVAVLLNHLKSDAERRKIMEVHEQSILLRKMMSFAERLVNFNLDVDEEMKAVGKELLATSTLVDAPITPSM